MWRRSPGEQNRRHKDELRLSKYRSGALIVKEGSTIVSIESGTRTARNALDAETLKFCS